MQEPIIPAAVTERMRQEWNERAREDAHFYVAFGRRGQDPDEFFDTATDTVRGLTAELKRLPAQANRRAWRALEIGCGPGRLLKPMSRHFGEIHGIDVSDEMIERARSNLRNIPHAHVHHTTGADLAPFADDSFHFIYSYAVFQHIPSLDVVMQYLREARRVLAPGGVIRAQVNGLQASAQQYDTWSGVRIGPEEIREFAREQDMQLLALEGAGTQYMWVTLSKPASATSLPTGRTRIRRMTNASSSEPVAPIGGRFAVISIWAEHLPPHCDLNRLEVMVDGRAGSVNYIGSPDPDRLQQVNVLLPKLHRTGLLPVALRWEGEPIGESSDLRVIPQGPRVPVLVSVSDGINLMSGTRVSSGTMKATIEEMTNPESFSATLDGKPVDGVDAFCTDPLPPRFEINFDVPGGIAPGIHRLEMKTGSRLLGSVEIEIVR